MHHADSAADCNPDTIPHSSSPDDLRLQFRIDSIIVPFGDCCARLLGQLVHKQKLFAGLLLDSKSAERNPKNRIRCSDLLPWRMPAIPHAYCHSNRVAYAYSGCNSDAIAHPNACKDTYSYCITFPIAFSHAFGNMRL